MLIINRLFCRAYCVDLYVGVWFEDPLFRGQRPPEGNRGKWLWVSRGSYTLSLAFHRSDVRLEWTDSLHCQLSCLNHTSIHTSHYKQSITNLNENTWGLVDLPIKTQILSRIENRSAVTESARHTSSIVWFAVSKLFPKKRFFGMNKLINRIFYV